MIGVTRAVVAAAKPREFTVDAQIEGQTQPAVGLAYEAGNGRWRLPGRGDQLFEVAVEVDGQVQVLVGRAVQNPDGTWSREVG